MSGFYGMGGPVARPVVSLASVAGVLTIDLAAGELFSITLAENITSILIKNAPGAGFGASFLLWITQHASAAKTITWPVEFKWAGGEVGTVSAGLASRNLLGASCKSGAAFDVTLSNERS